MDWGCGRLCGTAYSQPLSLVARNHELIGTKARPLEVSSHPSFADRAHRKHPGASVHREPRVHREACRRFRTPVQPDLRRPTRELAVFRKRLIETTSRDLT